jgi:hypothetical protein
MGDENNDADFDEDERIFHFTDAIGLYGILQSKCLWATHFQFLNDRNEIVYARDFLTQWLCKHIHPIIAAAKVNKQVEFPDGDTSRSVAKDEAEKFISTFYDVSHSNFAESYIFSGFCCKPNHPHYMNGGQLHWATYGKNGGYAIRLNPHKIHKLFDDENMKYQATSYISGKVVYSPDDAAQVFRTNLEKIGDVAKRAIDAQISDDWSNVLAYDAAMHFCRVTGLSKDAFFRGEEEARILVWRIVKPAGDNVSYPVCMRHRGGVTVPYIEIFKDILLGENNPVEAIIIGPHYDNRRRKIALKKYLTSVGLNAIEVHESNVPYTG